MDIFAQYDLNMCPAGCDEGYLKYVPFLLTVHNTESCVVVLRPTVKSTG